eukprot:10234617-Alexandrium_andersonii.AAC.1
MPMRAPAVCPTTAVCAGTLCASSAWARVLWRGWRGHALREQCKVTRALTWHLRACAGTRTGAGTL